MKKTTVAVLAAVLLVACLFAGCNGADGGKITDTQQDLSEAMTGVQDMMTEVSEAFTNAPDTDVISESVTSSTTDVTVTM